MTFFARATKIEAMITLTDSHTHCDFSHDSPTPARDMIEAAIKKGLSYLAITDHCDKDCVVLPNFEWVRQIDLPARFEQILALKKQYEDRIYISAGLEYGYVKEANPIYLDIEKTYPVDYVINSVHIVEGIDVYFAEFYEERTKREAYGQYLKAVLESLDVPYHYDTIGHIGYISRKATYADKLFRYSEFPDMLDEILKGIILREKALEVNTHSKGTLLDFIPGTDVLKRYRELGGKLLVFGSDAHTTDRICEKYNKVTDALTSLGFDSLYIYKQHRPQKIKLI